MQVKMLTLESGPAGSFQPGDVRTVTEEHGRELIAGHHAEEMPPLPEQATARPGEKAVMPTAAEADAKKHLANIATAGKPKKKTAAPKADNSDNTGS